MWSLPLNKLWTELQLICLLSLFVIMCWKKHRFQDNLKVVNLFLNCLHPFHCSNNGAIYMSDKELNRIWISQIRLKWTLNVKWNEISFECDHCKFGNSFVCTLDMDRGLIWFYRCEMEHTHRQFTIEIR